MCGTDDRRCFVRTRQDKDVYKRQIEEMKALFEKKKSLQICLEQHLKELEHRKEGLSKMQDICERLILEHRSLDSLNVEDCLEMCIRDRSCLVRTKHRRSSVPHTEKLH